MIGQSKLGYNYEMMYLYTSAGVWVHGYRKYKLRVASWSFEALIGHANAVI